MPNETPLEKTHFSFARSYRLETTSWLELGAYPLVPLSAGTFSGLNLGRPCGGCHSFYEFMCLISLLYVEDPDCFLGTIHPLWLLQSFCLFCTAAWFWQGEVKLRISMNTEKPKRCLTRAFILMVLEFTVLLMLPNEKGNHQPIYKTYNLPWWPLAWCAGTTAGPMWE